MYQLLRKNEVKNLIYVSKTFPNPSLELDYFKCMKETVSRALVEPFVSASDVI